MTMTPEFSVILNSPSREFRYLLFIDVTPEFRICSGLVPIVYDGEKYAPRGWKPGAIEGGNPENAGFTCTIEDIEGDLELRAYSDGWTNAEATLIILGAPWDGDVDDVEAWEPVTGKISQASGGHIFMNLRVTGGVGLESKSGLQVGDSLCRLTYKGARCKYAGSELTCPRTFDACENRLAGDNTANFRGARYAPEAGTVLHLGPAGATVPMGPPPPNPWPEDWRRRREAFQMPDPPVSTNGGGPPDEDPGTGPQQMENPNTSGSQAS